MKILKREISKEAGKYALVGSLGFVADVGLFNALSLYQISTQGQSDAIQNKILSTGFAILVTYLGNSRWTFRHRTGRAEGVHRISLYLAVNVIGMGISLVFLATSRYLLGFDSLLADNISGNILGNGTAVVFRFIANRYLVFPKANGGDGGI